MSHKVTLGGDRLGSGNKQKIEISGFERSTHDRGYLWRSTMSAGTLIPFMKQIALPGDTFDIHLNADVKTHPTVGPLFGSYKLQLDTFLVPLRLYNSLLHNNALGIGLNMAQVILPTITLPAMPIPDDIEDIDNAQINPSCLLSYLGIRGIGYVPSDYSTEGTPRTFQCVPLLAYWDIYKNYYANKQEEIGAVIHTPSIALIETVTGIGVVHQGTLDPLSQAPTDDSNPVLLGDQFRIDYNTAPPDPSQIIINTEERGDISLMSLSTGIWTDSGTTPGTLLGVFRQTYWGNLTLNNWRYQDITDLNNGKPAISTFNLSDIDDMRTAILAYSSKTVPFNIADGGAGLKPYEWLYTQTAGIPHILSSQEGLALKTYQSDLLNNWISTEWIDGTGGINDITAVSTTGDKFNIDTLILSKKIYDMLNRIAVSGGSYNDWLNAQYDHVRQYGAETPMYMGGLIKELVFQEVVSNSSSDTGQPLGTLAGKGVMSNKHKGGKIIIKVDEPSYIIGIVSLTPRIDNSQGNDWDVYALKTMNDLHVPSLDQIGFQELITEQAAWWDTEADGSGGWTQKSAGKQPAWINYMTNINQVRGNFAIKTNEMFMTLNRRYEWELGTGIKDMTTYIDPSKFNFIFAETSLDAQNFWTQIAVDITYRGKISAKTMPNL